MPSNVEVSGAASPAPNEADAVVAASGNTGMLEGATCGTQRQARCRRRAPRRRGEGFRGEPP